MTNSDFEGYLRVQSRNLTRTRRLPHFGLVDLVDALYRRSFDVIASSVGQLQVQLFVACHQALLSAAATIGRCQPVDAVAVTRRAVEIARVAAAINYDPD